MLLEGPRHCAATPDRPEPLLLPPPPPPLTAAAAASSRRPPPEACVAQLPATLQQHGGAQPVR